ncbi:hypothetical protein [Streptomyces chartreusis]
MTLWNPSCSEDDIEAITKELLDDTLVGRNDPDEDWVLANPASDGR